MVDRTSKQVEERYKYFLHPHLNKGKWTKEEDDTIIALVKHHGLNWSVITEELKQADPLNYRCNNSIKNRWHSNLKDKMDDIESQGK